MFVISSLRHITRTSFPCLLIAHHHLIMEIAQIYAIVAGGVFLVLIIIQGFPFIQRILQSVAIIISKYLTYPFIVRRHRPLGPWTPADVLLQLLYISLNVFCVTFRVTSFNEVGDRAGTLSIINMVPLFFGLHLSFLADLLGLSLSSYRRIHRSAGIMSFALVALHLFAAVHNDPTYSLREPQNVYLIIVSYTVVSADTSLTRADRVYLLSAY
jgi:hypothetical protein